MRLELIKYSEFVGQAKEWDLDLLSLDPINLIVGKNASGKTRTLRLINNLAQLIRGDQKPEYQSANFDASFSHQNDNYNYVLHISNGAVVKEEFKLNDKVLLSRGAQGIGTIFAEKLEKEMDFQAPPTELALTLRKDSIQHSYFEPLSEWARSVYYYAFGTSLGRETYAIIQKPQNQPKLENAEILKSLVLIFKHGLEKFGDKFKTHIRNDLEKIGYSILDIDIAPQSTIPATPPLLGLWVKEKDINAKIEQRDISQGMFRVISLIIQVNYSIMAHKPSCVIIDDIGEGLDFERSCALIELLISKIKDSDTQLLMATNDRFVMNKVPLEMWEILQRQGSHCKVFNIKNSKEKFDEFRFTGLNNFDFFATDYFSENKK